LFIATFLFFETRGLFVGWVRALAAAAFGLLSGWSLTVLMLHAVDPWMDALSDIGANGLADARTGITAAIIVLVFCAAQFGLMLAGIMIARGFRLPSRMPRASAQTAAVHAAQAPLPMDLISRPARLAEQLAHQETSAVHGERAHATATSVTFARREGSSPVAASPARIGDSYRRPAVTREGRRA
jgi:type IV secretion system protein VirB6